MKFSLSSLLVVVSLTGCGKAENQPVRVAAPDPAAEERRLQEEKELQQRRAVEAERALTAEFVKPLLPLAETSPVTKDPRALHRRGKVLVWDATTTTISLANDSLPTAMRGQRGDTELTLAVILNKRNVEVATYEFLPGFAHGQKIPGYRVEMDVCLVDVAEKKALGRIAFVGDEPPPTIHRRGVGMSVTDDQPEYGDANGPLARWLEHRPRAGQPDRVGEARKKVASCLEIGNVVRPIPHRVLIWDMAKDIPSSANKSLPTAIQGALDDPQLTLILIEKQLVPVVADEKLYTELFEMETARKKGYPAMTLLADSKSMLFREELTLHVVSFPDQAALGTATVNGAYRVMPSEMARGSSDVTVGDSHKNLANWIESRAVNAKRR